MTDMRKTLKVGLTGNTLKLIAIFTMLIDHIGAAVIETGILKMCIRDRDRRSLDPLRSRSECRYVA